MRELRLRAACGIGAAAMACRAACGKLRRDRRGAVAVEYGFLLALVVLAVLICIVELGKTNFDIWSNVAAKVKAVT